MSSPEAIAAELRAARPLAPERLREHVLALGEPAAPAHRSWRRPLLALAPAALMVSVAAALVIGLVQSGGHGQTALQNLTSNGQRAAPAPVPKATAGSGQAVERAAALPASGSRAKRYEAELTLHVRNLSGVTKRALQLTRSLGGYVRSVDYGQGQQVGSAYFVLRIPVRSIQGAILRFSALGTILAQHVSIQDVQQSLDRRFRQIRALEGQLAALERQGTPAALARAAVLRRRLAVLQREQAQALRQASFATVSLELETKQASVTPPRPGRIERTLDRAGTILVQELAVLLYVLVVALPLLLLGGAAYLAARALRRRALDRLLESS